MSGFIAREGATPINDISGLKLPIRTQEQLNAAEAQNIAQVVFKYLTQKPSKRTAPFSYEWLLQVHKEMFGDVWEWAGQLRTTDIANVGFVKPYRIVEEMHKLLDDLRYWEEKTNMDVVEQAVRLHHRAVWIHPFTNGNGRWSRMIADMWLKQRGRTFPIWPAEMGQESSPVRDEYIHAVKEADKGNFEPLLSMHRRYDK